jgi:hypothetical protein
LLVVRNILFDFFYLASNLVDMQTALDEVVSARGSYRDPLAREEKYTGCKGNFLSNAKRA